MRLLIHKFFKKASINNNERRITKNFVSLGSVHFLNFLIPLLLTPYIIKKVGIERFGMITLSQIIINYLIIITDYGFNLTATREVAINKDDNSKLNYIFSYVLTTKIILTTIGLLILVVSLLILPYSYEISLLYLFTFAMVIGQLLTPTWFFQGIENIKILSYFNTVSKILSVIFILSILQTKEDYIYINLMYGIGSIFTGISGLYIAVKYNNIKFSLSPFKVVLEKLREGWEIFITNIVTNLYLGSNLVILGLFGSQEIIGLFGIVERIINASRQILVVFYQVTYPSACSIIYKAKDEIRAFHKNIYYSFSFLVFIFSVFLFLGAKYIIYYFTATENNTLIELLRIMSLVPFIVSLNIFYNQILLASGYKKTYSYVLVIGSIFNILLNVFLSKYYLAYGTAVAVLLTEIFITAGFIIAYKRVSIDKKLVIK